MIAAVFTWIWTSSSSSETATVAALLSLLNTKGRTKTYLHAGVVSAAAAGLGADPSPVRADGLSLGLSLAEFVAGLTDGEGVPGVELACCARNRSHGTADLTWLTTAAVAPAAMPRTIIQDSNGWLRMASRFFSTRV